MRTTVMKLVEELAHNATFPEPIFEFGARRAEGQAHLPAIATLFPDARFVGCDMLAGPGVDEVQDLRALSFGDATIGSVLLLDTIEHVREPWRAMSEIGRCLRPGGLMVMTSVMLFPIHAHPDDYWRFTKSGFGVLLDGLDPIVVEAVGNRDLPHTVVAVASKGEADPALRDAVTATVTAWMAHGATSWKERALTLLPPQLVAPCYRAFRALQARRDHVRLG